MGDTLIIVENKIKGQWRGLQMVRADKKTVSEKACKQQLKTMLKEYRKEGYVVRGCTAKIRYES